jgi:hypothetical protein
MELMGDERGRMSVGSIHGRRCEDAAIDIPTLPVIHAFLWVGVVEEAVEPDIKIQLCCQ